MIGFPLQLPIEATTPRDMHVAEDVMLPSLLMMDGPALIIPLTPTEAAAVRVWLRIHTQMTGRVDGAAPPGAAADALHPQVRP